MALIKHLFDLYGSMLIGAMVRNGHMSFTGKGFYFYDYLNNTLSDVCVVNPYGVFRSVRDEKKPASFCSHACLCLIVVLRF